VKIFATIAGAAATGYMAYKAIGVMKYMKWGASQSSEDRLGELLNGAMLHGEPECGKTLIVRAIAGEAGVNILYIKGSDFSSKYGGGRV
jgi:SpoVK/Ycf46/Vps4 family AAA+-type ATPase